MPPQEALLRFPGHAPDRDVLCRMDPGDGGDAPPSEVRCRLLHGGDCLAEAVFVLE